MLRSVCDVRTVGSSMCLIYLFLSINICDSTIDDTLTKYDNVKLVKLEATNNFQVPVYQTHQFVSTQGV